jgi:hypothetical protein
MGWSDQYCMTRVRIFRDQLERIQIVKAVEVHGSRSWTAPLESSGCAHCDIVVGSRTTVRVSFAFLTR